MAAARVYKSQGSVRQAGQKASQPASQWAENPDYAAPHWAVNNTAIPTGGAELQAKWNGHPASTGMQGLIPVLPAGAAATAASATNVGRGGGMDGSDVLQGAQSTNAGPPRNVDRKK